MNTKLSQHPLSAAFPAMQADEYQALVDSIVNIGVQNPITLFEGMVIDGWHRYTAANESGMSCPVIELGDIDPSDYVLAQNKNRRHITVAQMAMAANAVFSWSSTRKSHKNHQSSMCAVPAHVQEITREQVAEKSGVSVGNLSRAAEIAKKAPEVAAAVSRGEIGLEKAKAITKLPKAEQAAAISKPLPKPAKPAPALPEDADYSGPDEAEIASILAEEKQNLAKVLEIMDSGDALGDALKENERLRMELATVKSQRDGFMNQCAELIRRVKSLRRANDKLQGK